MTISRLSGKNRLKPGYGVLLILGLVAAVFLMNLLLGGFMAFIIHQSQGGGGGNKVMSFGKSRARMQTDDQKKVTFANVEGAMTSTA